MTYLLTRTLAVVLGFGVCLAGCSPAEQAPKPATKPPPKNLRPLLPTDVRNKVETLEAEIAENQQRALDAIEGKSPVRPVTSPPE